jgi:hypothetical protein
MSRCGWIAVVGCLRKAEGLRSAEGRGEDAAVNSPWVRKDIIRGVAVL